MWMETIAPQEQPPATMNMRRMGDIAHDIYGIPVDDVYMEPLTLPDLRNKGYDDKEILSVIKSDLFRRTSDQLAEQIYAQSFIPTSTEWISYAGPRQHHFDRPQDLKTPDGRTNYPKLKIYLESIVDSTARSVWENGYQEEHPNAAAIVTEFSRDAGDGGDDLDLFGALNLGLDIILAAEKYIDTRAPESKSHSLAASMPTLYKIASQNAETTGSPTAVIDFMLEASVDDQQLLTHQRQLHRVLSGFRDDRLLALKNKLLEDLLEDEIYAKRETNVPLIEDMDNVLNNREHLINYLSGFMNASDYSFVDNYPFDIHLVTRTALYLDRLNVSKSASIREVFADIELAMRDYTLSDNYFSVVPSRDLNVMQIKLDTAETPELGRAKEKVFREETFAFGGAMKALDLQIASTPTTRCAAMNMSLSQDKQALLEPICKYLGFAPKRMNGIDVVTLLSLWATRQ